MRLLGILLSVILGRCYVDLNFYVWWWVYVRVLHFLLSTIFVNLILCNSFRQDLDVYYSTRNLCQRSF